MTRRTLLLSWVDTFYPVVYQDEKTNQVKGISIAFFKFVRSVLGNSFDYELQHYDAYRYGNWTKDDLGGAFGDVANGKVLTELAATSPDETYLQLFDLSPAIGTDSLAFYEADVGSKTWSPLSYFNPFSPLTLCLAVSSVVIVELLQIRRSKQSTVAAILTAASSSLFIFGMTLLLFAYNAGYQGTMIAPRPTPKITYDAMLDAFARGEKLWYFRTAGTILEFSYRELEHIPMAVEGDLQKLSALMCESPGRVIASLYEVEFFQLQLSDTPQGCRLQKINLLAPTRPSSTYYLFKPAFFYFVLPKKLPRALRNAINFVANSVLQADQRDTIFLHSSVYTRSFSHIFPSTTPKSTVSPLSIYSIGIILLIAISLHLASMIVFALEIVVYGLKVEKRLKNSKIAMYF